jgi:hypothetical protein
VTVRDLEIACRSCHNKEHSGGPALVRKPDGVPESHWRRWINLGRRGSPPRPIIPIPKEDKRPAGVPRKEWAAWLLDKSTPRPKPAHCSPHRTAQRS